MSHVVVNGRKRLKKVYVEITNVCNLSCNFCAINKREPAFMAIKDFETVLRNIKPVTDSIYLHVMGEPLMHEKIGEMLDICENECISASITTNASLLLNRKSQLIGKKSLRQINYSLHSLQNVKNYKKILNEVLAFVDETSNSLYHCLRFWNTGAENKLDIEILNTVCNHFNVTTTHKHENGIKISSNVFVQTDKPFSWPHRDGQNIVQEGKCMALRHNCGILVDGTIVPCCLDAEGDLPLGNIFNQPLDIVLASSRAKRIYDGFSKHIPVEPFCKSCGFLLRLNNKRKK